MVKTPRMRGEGTKSAPRVNDLSPDAVSPAAAGDPSTINAPVSDMPILEAMDQDAAAAAQTPDGPLATVEPDEMSSDPLPPAESPDAPFIEQAADPLLDAAEPAAGAETVQMSDRLETAADSPASVFAARADEAAERERAYSAPPRFSEHRDTMPTPAGKLPASRTGIGSLLGAGLAGGVAALALAALLQWGGVLPGGGNAGASSDLQAELASLRNEVAGLREQASAPPAPDMTPALDALRADVSTLKEAGNAVPPAVEARLASLERQASEVGETASADALAGLAQRVAAVEALGATSAQAATGNTERLAAIEKSVADLNTRTEALGQQPKVALAIAASALKSATERGAPFQAELETLRAVAPAITGTEALDAYAASGVPTRAEIMTGWNETAAAMVATGDAAGADAGIVDRLVAGARSLVSVRPVGAVTGTGVDATVARMEVALNAGNLSGALAEYDALPDAAKAAGKPLAEKVRARVEVERQVDAAIANVMKAA